MTTQTENETRADRAARTLDKAGDVYSSDREEAAIDLMTDVLHMLDTWYGIEPEDAHRMAWHHFMAERSRAEFVRRATRRKPGNCQECGHFKPVRRVTFWATGFPYVVCAECERAYRHLINWPVVEFVPR